MESCLPDDIIVRDDGKLALPSDSDPAVKRALGTRHLVAGLDLAMARDRTALVIGERVQVPYWVHGQLQALRDPVTTVIGGDFIEAADYNELVLMVMNLMKQPVLKDCKLIVDGTGVGAAWCDAFAAHPDYKTMKNMVRVQITSGENITDQRTHWRIARNRLFGDLGIALQNGDLRLADFPRRDDLKAEIEGLTMKINPSGQKRIEGGSLKRGASHADLAAAAGLMWFGLSEPQFFVDYGARPFAGLL